MESKENKWKTWLAGVRNGEKLPKKNQLVILFLVGLLLLVAVFPVPEEGSDDAGISCGDDQDLPSSDDAYGAYLEQKTAQTLENVEGVGEVTVMITLKSSSQKVVEKDRSSTSQTTDEADSSGGTRVTIIGNKGLVSLATYRPENREEFIALYGLGETTYNAYGLQFIQAIKDFEKDS